MMKLLRSGFSRMFKNRLFWICMVFSGVLGVFADIMSHIDYENNAEFYAACGMTSALEDFLFSGPMYLIFAAAVFVGPFLGTDYSCGTLRNKLIAGHKRSVIYLTNFIVTATANVGMLLVFNLTTIAVGVPLLGLGSLTVKEISVYTLSQCLTMVAFTALLVFLSMLFQSKAGGSIAVLLLTIVMFFLTIFITEKLAVPEYVDVEIIDGYSESVSDNSSGTVTFRTETIRSSNYVDGAMRDILEVLNDALPVNQFYQLITDDGAQPGIMAAYSTAITVLITGAGILLFRKRNLT